MERTLSPLPLQGTIHAIASKSHTHRLLICAALADRPTRIRCNRLSGDISATAACLQALGAAVTYEDGLFSVFPAIGGGSGVLPCGESGSTLRFLLPVAAALGKTAVFELEGRLPYRPMAALEEQLVCHGAVLSRPQPNRLCCSGRLQAGSYVLPGNISSQFISGLLLALPLLEAPSVLTVNGPMESAPYVELTLQVLRQFGVEILRDGQTFTILPSVFRSPAVAAAEGDWSNAAFWLTAGALGRPITVTGLKPDSLHGDRAIIGLLQSMGASVTVSADAVTVCPATLRPLELDAAATPDLVPVLAVAAAAADGVSRIHHAARLRLKESDRLRAVCRLLNDLGADGEETDDGLLIRGGRPLHGGTVDSFSDHRIAMAAAVASVISTGPVTICGAEAVEKSDPDFWNDFTRLQGGFL